MKFRKKPIVVEAVQLRWDTWSEMCDFAGVGKLEDGKPQGSSHQETGQETIIGLDIPTPDGLMHGNENDWIIRGIKGEFDTCKPDIFAETYEEVK